MAPIAGFSQGTRRMPQDGSPGTAGLGAESPLCFICLLPFPTGVLRVIDDRPPSLPPSFPPLPPSFPPPRLGTGRRCRASPRAPGNGHNGPGGGGHDVWGGPRPIGMPQGTGTAPPQPPNLLPRQPRPRRPPPPPPRHFRSPRPCGSAGREKK